MCKLHRDARHEPACVADVAAASREEEAGCQTLLVVVATRYCPRDGRLARPRQAAQPEDTALVLPIRPAVYDFQEVDARVGQVFRLMLLGVEPWFWFVSMSESTDLSLTESRSVTKFSLGSDVGSLNCSWCR